MSAQRLFLGVDGGQSSTIALISDQDGHVIGHGQGGPANHVRAEEGEARLTKAITESVGEACRRAELDFATAAFDGACLGFTAGAGDKQALLEKLIRARVLDVSDDATIALAGALNGLPGVIVMAGTGSIAFGRGPHGDTARAGGWGYVFGDEGSAFDLTRQALRAALRQEEGWGPWTSLHGRLLAATKLPSIRDVQRGFYTAEFSRPRIAGFAPLVTAAAAEGDAVAADLLAQAAESLAQFARVVRGKLFGHNETVAVSYGGGVFESELLLSAFQRAVEANHEMHVSPPVYGPAAGALIEAFRLGGRQPQLVGIPTGW
jgi:N-acetylglucosamine kinase-like BadF-type ATPase